MISVFQKVTKLIDIRIFMVIMSLPLAILAGYLLVESRYTELASIFIGLLSLCILAYPRLGFYIFVGLLFIPIGYFQRYFISIPNVIRWMPHFALLVSTISFLISGKSSKYTKNNALLNLFKPFALTLILLSILSGIYNKQSPVVIILGLRMWIFMALTIILFPMALTEKQDYIGFLQFLLIAGITQLPILIVQRLLFYNKNPDMLTGTFASYADLTFFVLFCIIVVLIWWEKKQKLIGIPLMLLLIIYILALALSNAKSAWLYLPAISLFTLRNFLRHFSKRSIVILSIMFIFTIGGAIIYDSWYRERNNGLSAIEIITQREKILNYLFSTEHDPGRSPRDEPLRRGEALSFNYNLIRGDLGNLIFGLGSGNLSESRVMPGHLIGSTLVTRTGTDSTTLVTVLGELGFMGILCVLWFLGRVFFENKNPPNIFFECINQLKISTTLLFLLFIPYYLVTNSLLALSIFSLVNIHLSETWEKT